MPVPPFFLAIDMEVNDMDKKRNSEQIDGELQTLRAKIRDLEAQKADHVKGLERAKAERKRSAYSAHGDKDPKAQERLAKARTAQRDSELALEDLESAIAEGRQRFEALQSEFETTYHAEQWAALFAEADQESAEADKIAAEGKSFAQRLARHQAKIEELRRRAHNLGCPRAFQTAGIRHALRVQDWYMIEAGVETEVEKPTPVYRTQGYGAIFREQVTAAKEARDRMMKERATKETPDPEPTETGAEAEATT